MAPPVAVYVVAAVVGVAAVIVFNEFVYEPHIAPRLEAWAEGFLQRRRAASNRRANAVPVRSSRRHHSSSSVSSHHNNDRQRDQGVNDGTLGPTDSSVDAFELEALASREVDEWRNEVLRSQERTRDGLRKRRTDRTWDDFDGFDTTSTTLDESFTSLTHTPLAPTHVVSNISSPMTSSTVSLPLTPTRRPRSESQSTTTQRDAFTLCIAPDSGPSHPLPFTPINQVMVDDSPFGPLLPDTPRSSAEIYGERPFSPITGVMGSSSGFVSVAASEEMLPSRTNSTSSIRTLGSSGVLRRGSGLVNEVSTSSSDDSSDKEDHPDASMSTFQSVMSLSERYPAPPTPPVIISSPASSVGVVSIPSSPRSGGSEVLVQHDAITTALGSPFRPLPQTHSSLPLLQLPSDSSSPQLTSLSRSPAYSVSPAVSYASFLSPMSVSRAASESEGDEFLSVASDDSDWSASPVTPGGHTSPVQDRVNNPFLDFEHLMHDVRENSSEHEDGSEGSEVLISDLGQEGGSEEGSDRSWVSAGRH